MFGGGPAAGDRAPDAEYGGEKGARLFELLRGTAHHVLLFDGSAATEAGYVAMARVGRKLKERYGKQVVCHAVVPAHASPDALGDMDVLLDHDGALHDTYGAGAECTYVIRPDGYIGFRSQPIDLDRLFDHMFYTFGDRS